jgi:hypothetical protein
LGPTCFQAKDPFDLVSSLLLIIMKFYIVETIYLKKNLDAEARSCQTRRYLFPVSWWKETPDRCVVTPLNNIFINSSSNRAGAPWRDVKLQNP